MYISRWILHAWNNNNLGCLYYWGMVVCVLGVEGGALWALNVYCSWILFPALTITETVVWQQTAFKQRCNWQWNCHSSAPGSETVTALHLTVKLSQLCDWQWNCHNSPPSSETVTALHLAVKLSQLCNWQWNCHSSATDSETVTALHLAVKLSQLCTWQWNFHSSGSVYKSLRGGERERKGWILKVFLHLLLMILAE